MWCDTIKLGSVTNTVGDDGEVSETIEWGTDVFCEIKSVNYKEFYEANAKGFKPTFVVKMHSIEYEYQEYCQHKSITYRVIRSYRTNDFCELTLERLINNGNA